MGIELYALKGCSDCQLVHDALAAADVEYEIHWVEALHSKRDEVARVSGQREVPVLVDTDRGVTMSQHHNIVEYVEKTLAGRVEA